MLTCTPFLLFDGNCAEAMTFYHQCLGGTLSLTPLADTPMKAQFPKEKHNRIINAHLKSGGFEISATDWMASPEFNPILGNMSAIFVVCDQADELRTVFDQLAQGAEKERFQALHEMPFGIYGQFYDRYGVQWIFRGDASKDEAAIRALYQQLLAAWNRRDAAGYAALFEDAANVTGFDGSQMIGRADIESEVRRVFEHHQTAAYVGKIREVRLLSPEVALLRAVVGMLPPGQKELNPAVNAIQSLVAVKQPDGWRIAQFQNTPAQFHGRPDLSEALTEELRKLTV